MKKVVIFAYIPPPYHGQSAMVQLMLDGLRNRMESSFRDRVIIYHVNARYAETIEQLGTLDPKKILFLLFYCIQAIFLRFRYGASVLYYVPAPLKIASVIRDCFTMILLRPFFSKRIYHHHAIGLGEWLDKSGGSLVSKVSRRFCRFLLGVPDLSVILSEYGRKDAAAFRPKRIAVVENGYPDLCPDFISELLENRLRRWKNISAALQCSGESSDLQLLFFGICLREKGIFDVIKVLGCLETKFRDEGIAIRMTLKIAGDFASEVERLELMEALADFRKSQFFSEIQIVGFVAGKAKDALLRESDLLVFPTYYSGEATPVVLIEALAYGMEVVTTNWRDVHKMLPVGMREAIQPGDIFGLCDSVMRRVRNPDPENARNYFLKNYSENRFRDEMGKAILSI